MDNSANKRYVLLIATLASFLTPFMGSSVNIALPLISKEFSMNVVLLSWIPTSYILAAAIFLVPFGRIADIYGRKMIFTYGILIYTVSSFLSAISPSAAILIASRVFHGIGSSMIFWDRGSNSHISFLRKGEGQGPGDKCCCSLFRSFSWTIFRWISHAALWMEKYLFYKCTNRPGNNLPCFLEVEGRVG